MSDPPQLQRPPAQPAYVLRGHHAHVHAVRFLRHNERLLTGDADGWVVLWNVATKRAVAVWRAHDGAILGFGTWPEDKVITHGRDFHLRVWQLGPADEHDFSTALPVDDTTTHRKQPWLLHSLRVNTLNFCSFATCPEHPDASNDSPPSANPILIAVPGMKDGEVDVFQLPTEHRMSTVPNIGQKTGMTMSVSLVHSSSPSPSSGPVLHCITGYESGTTAVHALSPATNTWSHIYTSQPHSQPLLSLSPAPPSPSSNLTFYTSGADDLIAKHTLSAPPSPSPPKPPSSPPSTSSAATSTPTKPQSLLSAALASQSSSSSSAAAAPPPLPNPAPIAPAKVVHTKHSGQQSLVVRSDGRVLATAGWDGRVRVYGAKGLKEVAVLAWHKEGCYAVAFADVGGGCGGGNEGKEGKKGGGEGAADDMEAGAVVEVGGKAEESEERAVARTAAGRTVTTVRARREERAKAVHWLAVGSKDGKVSLWEVF